MDTNESNVRDLLDPLRKGDEGAFDQVFRSYYADLVRMAESIVRGRALAEEIAQDVMLELWRRRESLEVEQNLRAYLIRSTRNRALNHIRHEKVVAREIAVAALDPQSSPSAEDDMMGTELEEAVGRAIEALPASCREVFQLSRAGGLKYSEIAIALDISVKTVEKRMGQALAELRAELAAWLPNVGASGKATKKVP